MMLLTTVLLLGLLTALIFSMQRAMWLYQKVHQKTQASHQAFDALEAVGLDLGKMPLKKACLGEALSVHELVFQLKSGHRCAQTVDKKKYYFWIDRLKAYPKQWIIGIFDETDAKHLLMLRFSAQKGLISWRYMAH